MREPIQGEWKVEGRFMRLHVGQREWALLQRFDERFGLSETLRSRRCHIPWCDLLK